MSASHLSAHVTRRHLIWERYGNGADFITFLAEQWAAYDRAHGISASDRAFSLVTYAQHQEAFTAWLEQRFAVAGVGA